MQLYLYSTCEKFNKRLEAEWGHMKEDCKEVRVEDVEGDQEVKCSGWVRMLSRIFKRFL